MKSANFRAATAGSGGRKVERRQANRWDKLQDAATITYMSKKPAASEKNVEATPVAEPKKSQKIPKLAKKDKRRLPRKEKKAKQKAALKA
jgi:hypothetical protein